MTEVKDKPQAPQHCILETVDREGEYSCFCRDYELWCPFATERDYGEVKKMVDVRNQTTRQVATKDDGIWEVNSTPVFYVCYYRDHVEKTSEGSFEDFVSAQTYLTVASQHRDHFFGRLYIVEDT